MGSVGPEGLSLRFSELSSEVVGCVEVGLQPGVSVFQVEDHGHPGQVHAGGDQASDAAEPFLGDFVQWYNHEHRHTGIGLHSPADVHYDLVAAKATDRAATLTVARAANPERLTSSAPPKILHLPDSAWINPPLPAAPAA